MQSSISVVVLGLVDSLVSFLRNNLALAGLSGLVILLAGFAAEAFLADYLVRFVRWTVDKVAKRLRTVLEQYIRSHADNETRRHNLGVWFARKTIPLLDWYITEATKRVDKLDELLRKQGFERLTRENISEEVCDPQYCWRRPFSFTEIHENYALDRERVGTGNERVNIIEELVSESFDAGANVVLGPPGSGKTTMLKSVAVRWYEENLGPVLYRKSGQQGRDIETESFENAIELTKAISGTTLVVVEDAMRPPTAELFEVIGDFRSDDDVAFLLDAREREWKSAEEVLGSIVENPASSHLRELRAHVEQHIEERWVPPLDKPEIVRFAEKFEEVTGRTVTYGTVDEQKPGEDRLNEFATEVLRDILVEQGELLPIEDREAVEQIEEVANLDLDTEGTDLDPLRREAYERITSKLEVSIPGSVLLLMYHLPVQDAGSTSLRGSVREVLQTVEGEADGWDLLQATALLANILNATEIGVRKELLYALGWWESDTETRGADFKSVEQCITTLDGLVLFGQADGTEYRSHHALWSRLYLEEFYTRYHDERRGWMFDTFEGAVNALFALMDDEQRREDIQDELRISADPFKQIDKHPEEQADNLVNTVFNLGRDRPPIAPLFATTERSGLHLPEVASKETKARVASWRAWMARLHADYETAWKEVETLNERINQHCPNNDELLGMYYRRQGNLHRLQSNPTEARQEYNKALGLYRKIDDHYGVAATLDSLGMIAFLQSDFEAAREYYEESLAIHRERNHRGGEALVLDHLGVLATAQDDYETARQYHKESLAINRERSDRQGTTSSLHNLGDVERSQDNYDAAREYYEESLAIARELGNRHKIGATLNNLGIVVEIQGDYEAAREYYEESLAVSNELSDRYGAAKSLHSLGDVAAKQSDYETAREYLEESLAIQRDLEDRNGVAATLTNLGNVARRLNEYSAAREYYEESLAIQRQLGVPSGAAHALNGLGIIAAKQNNFEAARKYYEESLAIKRELEDRHGEASSLLNLGNVARQQREYDTAREYYEKSLNISRELGVCRGEAIAIGNLGFLDKMMGELENARKNFKEALDILLDIGAVEEALQIYEWLAKVCAQVDGFETAIEYCNRAIETIDQSDIPAAADRKETFERLRLDFQEPESGPAQLYKESLPPVSDLDKLSMGECYTKALSALGRNEPGGAIRFLREMWNRREDIPKESGDYYRALAAGTLLAAHDQFIAEEIPSSEILDEISTHAGRLSTSIAAVFDYLYEGETEVSPEDATWKTDEDSEKSDEEFLEGMVCTKLLFTLSGARGKPEDDDQHSFEEDDTDYEANSTHREEAVAELRECYSTGLTAIVYENHTEAIDALFDAFDHADLLPTDADEFPTAVAAGVAIVALAGDNLLDSIRTGILDTADDHRSRLPQPAAALLETLDGTDPETAPDDLLADADLDGDADPDDLEACELDPDDLDLKDLETLAFARLLSRAEA